MSSVVVYSTSFCPYCFLAKRLLDQPGIAYEEHRFSRERASREQMARLAGGGWTYPQIVIDGKRVGGFVELRRADRAGELEGLGDPRYQR
jgi:glutaredoxin 3